MGSKVPGPQTDARMGFWHRRQPDLLCHNAGPHVQFRWPQQGSQHENLLPCLRRNQWQARAAAPSSRVLGVQGRCQPSRGSHRESMSKDCVTNGFHVCSRSSVPHLDCYFNECSINCVLLPGARPALCGETSLSLLPTADVRQAHYDAKAPPQAIGQQLHIL